MALLYLQFLPYVVGRRQEGSLRLCLTSRLPLPLNQGHKLSL